MGKIADQREALAHLQSILVPGSRVYTVLRHCSRSGMRREISLYALLDGDLVWLDGPVAAVLGYRRGKHDGVVVTGCGMDMGYHLVYHLGAALWPHGTPAPHGTRNGQPDTSGGYALRHQWI